MTDQVEALPTGAGVIASLGRLAAEVGSRVLPMPDGPDRVLLRDADGGERLVTLDDVGGVSVTKPGRIVQRVEFETEESLVAYANRFKASNSLLLASISASTVAVVLDYHASTRDDPSKAAQAAEFQADHGAHRVSLKLPFSLEWAAWQEHDGKLVPQMDFVRFVEENREDIQSPDAMTVLESCRDLQALRKVNFRSVVREDSDNYKIEYAEDAEAKANRDGVTLPAEFVLRIPVYFEDEPQEVHALLRWKVTPDGGLLLGYVLKRGERIRQEVFKGIVARIAAATTLDPAYGSIPTR